MHLAQHHELSLPVRNGEHHQLRSQALIRLQGNQESKDQTAPDAGSARQAGCFARLTRVSFLNASYLGRVSSQVLRETSDI